MSLGYLLDTSVLSMLAPGKAESNAPFADWVRRHGNRLFISAITIAEIEQGICRLRRLGGARRAEALEQWLGTLLNSGAEQIIPFDPRIAQVTGRLSDQGRAMGRDPGFADVGIAATAQTCNLVLLTRNTKHFDFFDITVTDPAVCLPDAPIE
ncbi:MAG: PIN domain-containing protein [Nevskiaceae bacterium]|nr:PIN domain-containing protein [Nevskiaceae bacterium]